MQGDLRRRADVAREGMVLVLSMWGEERKLLYWSACYSPIHGGNPAPP